MSRQSFALIGPGRVGIALAYLLRQRGFELRMVVGRSEQSLQRAESYLQGGEGLARPEFTIDPASLPTDLDFLLLGVRDDQLTGLIQNLWYRSLIRPKQVLIHLSGVHAANIGQLPGMTELSRLAMHPLQAVADVEAGINKLPEAVWSLEGDEKAMQLGTDLVGSLPARWIKISAEQKPLYHAAACTVSNYLVTLTQLGIEMLCRVGFPPELAQEALLPLIQGTVANLREKKPDVALTGPIARGDAATIAQHVEALRIANPDWLEVYRHLAEATLGFAPISADEKESIKSVLADDSKAGN